ncbi:MAG: LysR family transcriptional regulator [Burkholderiales bacterium]|nr:LysR family transcriptional regulator [Burkholderiales bacterium]
MHVTLAQLRAFERIVRLGSFHAAARELKLSQPSVSQRIRELETALQTPLFVRAGPRVSLTAEGHALVEYADRMLAAAGELAERFRTRDPLKGTLRLGVSETFAFICLPELLKGLERRYPAIRANVFVGDTGVVSARLNDQTLDIAVVSEPTVAAHVSQEPLGTNVFGWFASASLRFPRRAMVPADLAHHQLIVPAPPARLHATVAKWFADAGVKPRRVSTCNSIHATIEAIGQGAALGIVPVRLMRRALEEERVRWLKVVPPVPGHRVAVCYQIREFGPSLRLLVDLIRELARRHDLFS